MAAQLGNALAILRLKQVQARTGISRSGIYQKMADGDFPKNITLGPRAVGWIDSSIDDWIQSRIDQSNKAGV